MKVRADVAELLRAGLSDSSVARQLNMCARTVAKSRAALGLPKHKSGIKPAGTPEDLFWLRVKPTADGHMEWTGYRDKRGMAVLRHGGRQYTAYRLAFIIANGREPEGYSLPSCGWDHCVKPGHHQDQADRAREKRVNALYAGIFGPSP